jgi:transportin-1
MYAQNPQSLPEVPDKDFIVVALDLISGVVQGLGPDTEALMNSIQPSTLQLLLMCMKDQESNDVQQSSFALIGDLAISCFNVLVPYIQNILEYFILQIVPDFDATRSSVVNNAIWATGEIALRYGTKFLSFHGFDRHNITCHSILKLEAKMEPFIPPLLQRLVPLLQTRQHSRAIPENAAITIGRLALVCPQPILPHLGAFIQPL